MSEQCHQTEALIRGFIRMVQPGSVVLCPKFKVVIQAIEGNSLRWNEKAATWDPLISRFGSRAGRTVGSCCDPSKVSLNSTVSYSKSVRKAELEACCKRHSVYLHNFQVKSIQVRK